MLLPVMQWLVLALHDLVKQLKAVRVSITSREVMDDE